MPSPQKKRAAQKKGSTGRRRKQTMASKADRYALYEKAVQDAKHEIDFIGETFTALRGRRACWLREDFCGSAAVACEWVRRNRRHHAVGVDIDAEVLDWGQAHHLARLAPATRRRIELIQSDVLRAETEPMDVVLAINFSYWVFKERRALRQYFKRVYRTLNADGVFFLDAFGGYDAFREMRERRDCGGFTYIWEQARYDPMSGDYVCRISFKFPDGSRLAPPAFSYEWRLWTLPELREVLAEAGFSRTSIYWEGTDEDGEGNGEFLPAEHGEADPAWVVYIIAER
jgi:SAM-dependent methyltransferase